MQHGAIDCLNFRFGKDYGINFVSWTTSCIFRVNNSSANDIYKSTEKVKIDGRDFNKAHCVAVQDWNNSTVTFYAYNLSGTLMGSKTLEGIRSTEIAFRSDHAQAKVVLDNCKLYDGQDAIDFIASL
ncbi:MAG: hypothetical protein J6B16_01800 [Clostridia bacterium]|nr:hypothetical protein [Clostridia bacterium]